MLRWRMSCLDLASAFFLGVVIAERSEEQVRLIFQAQLVIKHLGTASGVRKEGNAMLLGLHEGVASHAGD